MLKTRLKAAFIRRQIRKRKIVKYSTIRMNTKQSSAEELFNDSSYFNGIANDGSFFLARMSFRTRRPNEHWLEVYFPDLGLLRQLNSPGEEGQGFKQGSLSFEMVNNSDQWKIAYQGEMTAESGIKAVKIDLIFKPQTPIVDFQFAANIEITANAIAAEPWSRAFFDKLKEIKKAHFEQGGQLTGAIEVDGESRAVDYASMRDHSWGIRKWGDWKRHAWMCGMLDNGDCLNLSMISYQFLGELCVGFYIRNNEVFYLTKGPKFADFGIDPLFPNKANLTLVFGENRVVEFSWERINFVPYTMDQGEYQIFEGISKGTVNGTPIKLVTEFGFNPLLYDL